MARLAIALALSGIVCGCTGKDPYNAGEPVGQFRVTGKLVSSSCGSTPNPWQFEVKLRHDMSDLYWVQGGAPVRGRVDANARAVLESIDTRTIREADPRYRVPACTLARKDTLDVVLATERGPSTDVASTTKFSGTLKYAFRPTEGSDCSDQLLSTSGDYEALPCEIVYELAAERTGDLPR